jgi:hypothetical protein
MKAFLVSIVVLLAVAFGAAYVLDQIWGQSSGDAYVSDNVRRT